MGEARQVGGALDRLHVVVPQAQRLQRGQPLQVFHLLDACCWVLVVGCWLLLLLLMVVVDGCWVDV